MLKLNRRKLWERPFVFTQTTRPKKGQRYAPYAFRTTTGIHTTQLNSRAYNYPEKSGLRSRGTEKALLVGAIRGRRRGRIFPMITYSLPLINDKDEAYAVYACDYVAGLD